jgi:hypothetical protein
MIDSQDRPSFVDTNPWDLQFTQQSALANGFFTRIATTEVVLKWFEPNIRGFTGRDLSGSNNVITFDISGYSSQTITLIEGFYNVAQALDTIVISLNDLSGSTGGEIFSIEQIGGVSYLVGTPHEFRVDMYNLATNYNLAFSLGLGRLDDPANYANFKIITNPNLQSYNYIDFTSEQLTYNQEVKDASTSTFNRNVLCRWYMSWDSPPEMDKYGFPILMGYTAFSARRIFNPPKQIQWSTSTPVGNLAFQVYFNTNFTISQQSKNSLPFPPTYEQEQANLYLSSWAMTLQLSEN